MTTRNYVIDGKPFDVEIVERSGTHALVRVNGQIHRVEGVGAASLLEEPSPSSVAHAPVAHAPVARRPVRAAAGEVRAPMAGRVVQLHLQAGEHVVAGAPLLVLDAMKMENTIQAPRDGRVDEIAIGVGDTVLQGALLVRLA